MEDRRGAKRNFSEFLGTTLRGRKFLEADSSPNPTKPKMIKGKWRTELWRNNDGKMIKKIKKIVVLICHQATTGDGNLPPCLSCSRPLCSLKIKGGIYFLDWISHLSRNLLEPLRQLGKIPLHPAGVRLQHFQSLFEHVQIPFVFWKVGGIPRWKKKRENGFPTLCSPGCRWGISASGQSLSVICPQWPELEMNFDEWIEGNGNGQMRWSLAKKSQWRFEIHNTIWSWTPFFIFQIFLLPQIFLAI